MNLQSAPQPARVSIEAGPSVPRVSRPLRRAVGVAILRLTGWRVRVKLPDEPKMIIIVAPHTSNWDFVFGIAAIFALQLPIHWFAKHTLFQGLAGRFFRRLGGLPVDRSAPGGLVTQTANLFREHEQLLLAITPEGTRSRQPRWKRGFCHIAMEAQVPIAVGYLDFGRRLAGIDTVFRPSGDWDRDMAEVLAFYRSITACRPENFAVDGDDPR